MYMHATLSPSFPHSPFLFLSLSLTGEQGAHTLFTGQREREIGRDTETEGGRGRERIFIFKRNDGCLATLYPFLI
jgi:hypothetical protein